jgi:hypothetical protein
MGGSMAGVNPRLTDPEKRSDYRRQLHRRLAVAGVAIAFVGFVFSVIFAIRSNTCLNAAIMSRTVSYSCSQTDDIAHASYLVFLGGVGLFVAAVFFLPVLRQRDEKMGK